MQDSAPLQHLLEQALRCEIPVLTFWDMTPREAMLAIDAASWRLEQRLRMDLSLAWHVAALSRTKTLPDLTTLLKPPTARKLEGAELEKRRREFEEMKVRFGR